MGVGVPGTEGSIAELTMKTEGRIAEMTMKTDVCTTESKLKDVMIETTKRNAAKSDNEAMIGKESVIKTVAKIEGKTKEAEVTGKMGDYFSRGERRQGTRDRTKLNTTESQREQIPSMQRKESRNHHSPRQQTRKISGGNLPEECLFCKKELGNTWIFDKHEIFFPPFKLFRITSAIT